MTRQTSFASGPGFTAVWIALITVCALLVARTSAVAGTPSAHHHAHHHAYQTPLLHALDNLDLSAAQRLQLQSVINDGPAPAPAESDGNDYIALNNPGDPAHATAVRAAQLRATSLIQRKDVQDTRIYALLTPEQRARLPAALAESRNIYLPDEKPHMTLHRN